MVWSAAEIVRAHAEIGRVEDVVAERRGLYAAVLDVFGGADLAVGDPDLVDSPAVRGHLGEVLGGLCALRPSACVPVTGLVAAGFAHDIAGCTIRLATTAAVPDALAGALVRVASTLQRHGERCAQPAFLTDPDATATAFVRIVDGVRIAVATVPELALDLLSHVSMFAVVTMGGSDRLGSASVREYPGVVLIPEPRSALEVTEALVHEGAHQKFFDLATTRSLLAPSDGPGPRFSPSWAPATAPSWPIEQAFPAWHAYCCLAALRAALPETTRLPADSLLTTASERADEIGRWLLGNGRLLGRDGHALLAAVLGRAPADDPAETDYSAVMLGVDLNSAEWVQRPVSGRTLLLRRARQPVLYWVGEPSRNRHRAHRSPGKIT